MFIITFSSARFINKIFYFAKVYVLSLIAMVYEVNYSKTHRFPIRILSTRHLLCNRYAGKNRAVR